LWHDKATKASWDIKSDARHEVMFLVKTKTNGDVFIVYASAEPQVAGYHFDKNSGTRKQDGSNKETGWGKYVYVIVPDDTDNTLHTTTKDLQADLKASKAFANDSIEEVNYMLVINRDKGKDLWIDNVTMSAN